jgi:hypothetical protein
MNASTTARRCCCSLRGKLAIAAICLSSCDCETDTPLYHKEHRNLRGQLYDIRLSTVNDDGNWNRGAIVNYYSLANYGFGTSGTDNNGNLLVQQY